MEKFSAREGTGGFQSGGCPDFRPAPPCLPSALPCANASDSRPEALQDARIDLVRSRLGSDADAAYGFLLAWTDRPRLIHRSILVMSGFAPVRRDTMTPPTKYQRTTTRREGKA